MLSTNPGAANRPTWLRARLAVLRRLLACALSQDRLTCRRRRSFFPRFPFLPKAPIRTVRHCDLHDGGNRRLAARAGSSHPTWRACDKGDMFGA